MFLKCSFLECFHLNLEINFHLNLFPDLNVQHSDSTECGNVQLLEDGAVSFSSNLSLRVFQVP